MTLCLVGTTGTAAQPWELPPLRYAETPAKDRIAEIAAAGAADEVFKGSTPLEKLRAVLVLLEIPVESQVLVFSKTSAQNPLIHPQNPRAIFFNEDSYVGYVPGGMIEVITQDALLGAVFYLIDPGAGRKPTTIQRDSASCMSCHATSRTESVPGVLVRSVHPDEEGHLLLALGTSHIDHTSPISERWGGYYVTGNSSLPHFGNQTFEAASGREFPRKKVELRSVAERVPAVASNYPRETSDIVALMVLEHQCRIHNLLNAASVEYRRAHWLAKSIDPVADPDTGSAGRYAIQAADRIVDLLLFKDEAEMGEDGVEGDPAFQEAFANRFPISSDGRSLADFQLYDRMFKYRCSFMVYSSVFDGLPLAVKRPVILRLRERLGDGEAAADWLKPSERQRIVAILSETLPAWSELSGADKS